MQSDHLSAGNSGSGMYSSSEPCHSFSGIRFRESSCWDVCHIQLGMSETPAAVNTRFDDSLSSSSHFFN